MTSTAPPWGSECLNIYDVTTGRGLCPKTKISEKRHILGIVDATDLWNQIKFFPKIVMFKNKTFS